MENVTVGITGLDWMNSTLLLQSVHFSRFTPFRVLASLFCTVWSPSVCRGESGTQTLSQTGKKNSKCQNENNVKVKTLITK